MKPAEAPLTPARIEYDAGGVPHAHDFGDVYHSVDGGPEQCRHVFLAGNDLPRRWQGRDRFAILETGFGLGLNFLVTAAAWLNDPQARGRLHFVSVEQHPPRVEDLERAHARWSASASLALELRRQWPPALRGFHRIEFAQGRIVLTLLLGDAAPMLAELAPASFDAFYLDGFAPEKNPRMWSPAVFAQIARLGRGDATAATWSVAAIARRGLQSAGYTLERRPGFGRKREMLCARRAAAPEPATRRVRRAIVIGAGAAGCWTAHALARRGWEVVVLERRDAPAREASGNPVGALRPALNLADNENARLARAAFLHASRTMARDCTESGLFRRTGLLHLALEREGGSRPRSQADQAARMQAILVRHGFPDSYAGWVDIAEATRRAGRTVGGPGWWIPAGGWVRPAQLCQRLIEEAGPRASLHTRVEVAGMAAGADGWQIEDAEGHVIAEAPVVVVANAYAAAGLGLTGLPRLIAVRGQISLLPTSRTPGIDCVVCGDGYAAPLPGGGLCVGATFEPGSTALDLRVEDHAQNLHRAQRMLPGAATGIDASRLTGRAALRTATADRLPACGELAPQPALGEGRPGLMLLSGLGARGLVWAPLCADILACTLEDEPVPLEASLVHAMRATRDAVSA